MSGSSPVASPRTSLTKIETSTNVSASAEKGDQDKNDLNNNDDNVMPPKRLDVPVRKIAGKKISVLFEVWIVFLFTFVIVF